MIQQQKKKKNINNQYFNYQDINKGQNFYNFLQIQINIQYQQVKVKTMVFLCGIGRKSKEQLQINYQKYLIRYVFHMMVPKQQLVEKNTQSFGLFRKTEKQQNQKYKKKKMHIFQKEKVHLQVKNLAIKHSQIAYLIKIINNYMLLLLLDNYVFSMKIEFWKNGWIQKSVQFFLLLYYLTNLIQLKKKNINQHQYFLQIIKKDYIICSCSDGLIRIFQTITLDHITTLPKPPGLLNYNVEKGANKIKNISDPKQYADCIAIQCSKLNYFMCSIYSDLTVFIWELKQMDKVNVKRSFLNHSQSINQVSILNQISSQEVTFYQTISQDSTVRVWHLISDETQKNAYSKHLSKILYFTDDYTTYKINKISQIQNSQKNIVCSKSTDQEIILCNEKGQAQFVKFENFQTYKILQLHNSKIFCIDIIQFQNYNFLCTASEDYIIIYDFIKEEVIEQIDEENVINVKFFLINENIYLIYLTSQNIFFRKFQNIQFIIINQISGENFKCIDSNSHFQQFYVALENKINYYDVDKAELIKSFDFKDEDNIMWRLNNFNGLQYKQYSFNNSFEFRNNLYLEINVRFKKQHIKENKIIRCNTQASKRFCK
ncbi:hypothetical protein IMG5_000820 [Ichthyophthirius multifiliis]|uniref:WD40-repeat-containing domain n=1 Tax=Ichthyophthirius multifiliis TaxID=5932 RepID=G0QIW9_ICHMU|nr:hypothetical protein IMG5_000820 [Ichthyophthirius multifiliis]EGR34854.1 hypothetical protein IMG5_000820 [Ichthyophthirius multifiliis]|eukprot:XP_004040158.1 hypothetical protein IMG5_000820 [Ichthyophthirius multifiliis]